VYGNLQVLSLKGTTFANSQVLLKLLLGKEMFQFRRGKTRTHFIPFKGLFYVLISPIKASCEIAMLKISSRSRIYDYTYCAQYCCVRTIMIFK
jgi:hypothetical protein